MSDEIPRQADMLRWSPAEMSIYEALQRVESLGAHPMLTEAVVALGHAKKMVGDWIDNVEPPVKSWTVLFKTANNTTYPRYYNWADGSPLTRAQALTSAQADMKTSPNWLLEIEDMYPTQK